MFFSSTAFSGGAAGLVVTGYLAYNQLTAVTGLTIAVGLSGFAMAGFNVNHIDIAPKFAGVLMGITNTAATIPGFVGPQVATAIAVKVNLQIVIDHLARNISGN